MPLATPVPLPADRPAESADERFVMYNLPWSAFEAQLALRGDAPVPRVAYLDGTMELLRPSREHERLKSYIGCLVVAYALERGLDLSPYGAWTLCAPPRASAVEPDECFIIGPDQRAELPDLAIEVVWTSGWLDKLEIYGRLGVSEIWVWRDGKLSVHMLRGAAYEQVEHSEQFPGIDVNLLASFLDRPTATQAVRAYRLALGTP